MVFNLAHFRRRFLVSLSVKSVLIQCRRAYRIQIPNRSAIFNYLLSTFPFFSICTKDCNPFSALKVRQTSRRKSRAISSLIRCSLINESNTVGGTDPLAVAENEKKIDFWLEFRQKKNNNQIKSLINVQAPFRWLSEAILAVNPMV